MKWIKIRLKTTTEAEDIVSSMLTDLGVEGIEIEDNIPLSESDKQNMFVDILPEIEKDDGVAYISFYLETDADKSGLLTAIKKELEDMRQYVDVGACTFEESETQDLDWMNNWKQYFKQFYVDDMLIIPSWEEVKPEDSNKLTLRIDPGTAFGTGMHETTQLCLKQLGKYLEKGDKLLDVGCGSGILSIAAVKLGAESAVCTDLDPSAVAATEENMEVNHVAEECYQIYRGNIIDDISVQEAVGYECFDVVLANILADVLVPLTPVVVQHLKQGGFYIMSGIIKEKEQEVSETVTKAGFRIMEVNYQGDWVSITAKKD